MMHRRPNVGHILTWARDEVSVHCIDEALLVFLWWNDCNLLAVLQTLLGLVFKRLGKGVAACNKFRRLLFVR